MKQFYCYFNSVVVTGLPYGAIQIHYNKQLSYTFIKKVKSLINGDTSQAYKFIYQQDLRPFKTPRYKKDNTSKNRIPVFYKTF